MFSIGTQGKTSKCGPSICALIYCLCNSARAARVGFVAMSERSRRYEDSVCLHRLNDAVANAKWTYSASLYSSFWNCAAIYADVSSPLLRTRRRLETTSPCLALGVGVVVVWLSDEYIS